MKRRRIFHSSEHRVTRAYAAAVGLAKGEITAYGIGGQTGDSRVGRTGRVELADECARGRVNLIDIALWIERGEEIAVLAEGQACLEFPVEIGFGALEPLGPKE